MTGTDRMKTSIVLDTMVTMFSEYCSQPFIIEPVIIEHSDGKTEQTPELKYMEQKVRNITTYANDHFKTFFQG